MGGVKSDRGNPEVRDGRENEDGRSRADGYGQVRTGTLQGRLSARVNHHKRCNSPIKVVNSVNIAIKWLIPIG